MSHGSGVPARSQTEPERFRVSSAPGLALEQCGSLRLGLGAVASSVLAIKGSLRAISCGSGSALGRRDAVGSSTLAVLYRAQHDPTVRIGTVLRGQGGSVPQQGRPIARHRRKIAGACSYIAGGNRREARPRSLLALQRTSVAKAARRVEHGRITAFRLDRALGEAGVDGPGWSRTTARSFEGCRSIH